ncbi:hypothetical protein Bbelb_254320 [Branchiostoma belcheri]|nr:hypothetical protein Bbelb_254320 [Branchiostoma belcheri]
MAADTYQHYVIGLARWNLPLESEYKDNEIEQLRKELQDERRERVRSDLLAERYSRKADIIIRGLPYNKEENCEVLFDDFLVVELGFDKSTPLVAVYRLSRPTKTRPNPPLLARLVNFHDRDRILKEGRKLRGTGFAVYEHLPHRYKQPEPSWFQSEMLR